MALKLLCICILMLFGWTAPDITFSIIMGGVIGAALVTARAYRISTGLEMTKDQFVNFTTVLWTKAPDNRPEEEMLKDKKDWRIITILGYLFFALTLFMCIKDGVLF